MSRVPKQTRLPLVVLLGALVVAVAAFGATNGLGEPDVPSDAIAVVEDAPEGSGEKITDCHGNEVVDDPGTITEDELDCALEQAAARAGLQEVPKEGTVQYENVEVAAVSDMLDTVWIRGEAEEQGVSISEKEIDEQLDLIKNQNFRSEEEFQRFLEESGFTEADVNLRVELQLLSQRLQLRIERRAPEVTDDDIEEYYEASKSEFEQPETRDVRLVLNSDAEQVEKAKAELEADSSAASWRGVVKEYSTDPASRGSGGLRPKLTEGLLEEPLNGEVFAAETGEIVGPVKTPVGTYVFEVVKVTPSRTLDLREVRDQIVAQLEQVRQQEAFQRFVDDYGSKWQSRTVCAGGYVIERCDNYPQDAEAPPKSARRVSPGHPPDAPFSCYREEEPKRGRPPCPAPVIQLQPALPGTVTVINPGGTRLPQTPRPPGLEKPAPTGLPGAVPGAPPTVPPPPGSP